MIDYIIRFYRTDCCRYCTILLAVRIAMPSNLNRGYSFD